MATKTDNGLEFPAEAYAYVPDAAESSTWKIRLWATPETKVTREQLGAAAAAVSPGGFRGEKADIPAADLARVKARIRGAYQKLGVAKDDMPESVQLSDGPDFFFDLRGLTMSDDADKTVRIPIAKLGTYHKGTQKFSITRADIAQLASNFAKRDNGEVVIDYEHASENPEVAMGGPVPAAGWIVGLDAAPDKNGIAWGDAKFNERARELIATNQYRYGSPAINWGVRDKRNGEQQGTTLTSFALTNTPFLDGMPAIRLSDAAWSEKGENEQDMAKEKVMCSEHPRTPMLCPQCDADEIKTLNASDHQHQHTGPKVVQLSEVRRDGKGRLDLSSLNNEAVVSIEVMRAVDSERVALSEVAEAVKAGKVLPAQRDQFEKIALSDIANFRSLVATMKPQVDLTEHGLGGAGSAGPTTELGQIEEQIRVRASEIAKADGKPFHEAMKLAASEKPDLVRRRRVIRLGLDGKGDN